MKSKNFPAFHLMLKVKKKLIPHKNDQQKRIKVKSHTHLLFKKKEYIPTDNENTHENMSIKHIKTATYYFKTP